VEDVGLDRTPGGAGNSKLSETLGGIMKMKAEKFKTFYGTVFVAVHTDGEGFAQADHVMITIDGGTADILADGIVRMINERQCSECGRFNGLHGEIHVVTGYGNGTVEGFYRRCSKASLD
jgi:hypothetical protein